MNASDTLHELRARRRACNASQATLGKLLGWPQSIVSDKEKGRRGTWLHELDAWREALDRLERDQ